MSTTGTYKQGNIYRERHIPKIIVYQEDITRRKTKEMISIQNTISQNHNNVFSDEERWNNNISDTQYFNYGHGVNYFHDTDIKYKREDLPKINLNGY